VTIYNLLLQEKRLKSNIAYFQYKESICTFIEKHWDVLCHKKNSKESLLSPNYYNCSLIHPCSLVYVCCSAFVCV
jgi:hypothetical protein